MSGVSQGFNSDINGNIGVAGTVSATNPSYTAGSASPVSLTVAGNVRVDGSSVTQPVSATSLPLPSGAATSALQTTINTSIGTSNTTLAAITAQLPTSIGQKTSAQSLAVVLASDEVIPVTQPMSSNATLSSVAASTTSVVILAASAATKGWTVVNDSTSIMYLAYAGTASATAYTFKLFPNQQITQYLTYGGALSAIWLAANGNARVTQQI